MTGYWSICVPEAGTNLVTDPECTALDIYNAASSTVTVDTTYARFGYTCLKCVTSNATDDEGVITDTGTSGIAVSVGSSYTFSVYIRGSGTFAIGITWYTAAGAFISDSAGGDNTIGNTGWTRYTLTGTAPATAAFAACFIYSAQSSSTIYVDGFQFEAKSYATTFMSGNQPGCKWNGLTNASTSTRDANYRLGGRLRDIEDTYSIRVRNTSGAGVPPIELHTQPLALQPGSVYQSDKYLDRNLNLIMSPYGTSNAQLLSRRKALWDVIKPEAYGQSQPFLLAYTGNTRTVYGVFRYAGGWELGETTGGPYKIEQGGSVGLRLQGLDPFWYEDDQQQVTLDFNDTLASDQAFARVGGAWRRLGSGFNGNVFCVTVDNERNRVYFGGSFTTANGVTVNGICYFDGTTFRPLGAATKGVAGGSVYAIAIDKNGDAWAGGDFTTAGGSACKGLASWAVVGTSAPTAFNSATSFTVIKAIAFANSGRVYIGGTFTEYGTTANATHIAYSDNSGAGWSAISATAPSGGTPIINAITLDLDGVSIYFGGDFTGVGGVSNTARIAKFNGTSTITALSTGIANNAVKKMVMSPEGMLYVGGTFTSPGAYLARWNGSFWVDLLESYAINSLRWDYSRGELVYLRANTDGTVRAYNGSYSYTYDLTLSSVSSVESQIAVNKYGDLFLANGNAAATADESGITSITSSSAADTYPIIVIVGPSSSSAVIRWIENQTTGHRLYFNLLQIYAGETITIDLSPNAKTVTSSWRGAITNNPINGIANFRLAPGANTIAAYIVGTLTAITMTMRWQTTHSSVDGAA